jgi:hypothetical protein
LALGTTIIPNAWYVFSISAFFALKCLFRAMTRDPLKYENPEEFNPDRFVDENNELDNDDMTYTFGFGRRFVPHCTHRMTFVNFRIESAPVVTWLLRRYLICIIVETIAELADLFRFGYQLRLSSRHLIFDHPKMLQETKLPSTLSTLEI